MAKSNPALEFTMTTLGDIPHYPLHTNMGIVYCPVKLKLNPDGRVMIPHHGTNNNRLPTPVIREDKLVFVAPGGVEITAQESQP